MLELQQVQRNKMKVVNQSFEEKIRRSERTTGPAARDKTSNLTIMLIIFKVVKRNKWLRKGLPNLKALQNAMPTNVL